MCQSVDDTKPCGHFETSKVSGVLHLTVVAHLTGLQTGVTAIRSSGAWLPLNTWFASGFCYAATEVCAHCFGTAPVLKQASAVLP